jgi:hypothetical protein
MSLRVAKPSKATVAFAGVLAKKLAMCINENDPKFGTTFSFLVPPNAKQEGTKN